jgi:hypothetical protein
VAPSIEIDRADDGTVVEHQVVRREVVVTGHLGRRAHGALPYGVLLIEIEGRIVDPAKEGGTRRA